MSEERTCSSTCIHVFSRSYVEVGLPFDPKELGSPDFYKAAWERSPIRYVNQVKHITVVPLLKDTLTKGHMSNKDRIIWQQVL